MKEVKEKVVLEWLLIEISIINPPSLVVWWSGALTRVEHSQCSWVTGLHLSGSTERPSRRKFSFFRGEKTLTWAATFNWCVLVGTNMTKNHKQTQMLRARQYTHTSSHLGDTDQVPLPLLLAQSRRAFLSLSLANQYREAPVWNLLALSLHAKRAPHWHLFYPGRLQLGFFRRLPEGLKPGALHLDDHWRNCYCGRAG